MTDRSLQTQVFLIKSVFPGSGWNLIEIRSRGNRKPYEINTSTTCMVRCITWFILFGCLFMCLSIALCVSWFAQVLFMCCFVYLIVYLLSCWFECAYLCLFVSVSRKLLIYIHLFASCVLVDLFFWLFVYLNQKTNKQILTSTNKPTHKRINR